LPFPTLPERTLGLVFQGTQTEDRILPIDATGRRLPDLLRDI
jgi:hypothetical protein